MSNRKKINIGLFGFGVVGEGIYEVLNNTPSLNASIKKVCIKHPDKKRNAPAELFTTDAALLINDPEINVIVELIDNADEAVDIVTAAIQQRKSVVSANKKMIAQHMQSLLALKDEQDVSFLYEAAVCGSIPVIRNLEEYYDNDLLQSLKGIVNGSTNFILTQMIENQLDFTTALQIAQEKGFAESNPALDVEGIDAVNKLTIILKHTYGLCVDPTSILHLGITRIHPFDIQFSKEKGYKIKLVAQVYYVDNNEVVAYVLPTFVTNKSKFYSVDNEYNGVLIGSKLADEQFLYGKGAGRYPTSSAVLSDISALQYDYAYEYRKSQLNQEYSLTDNYNISIYLHYNNDSKDLIDLNLFQNIHVQYHSSTNNYVIGTISIATLKESNWLSNPNISIITFE